MIKLLNSKEIREEIAERQAEAEAIVAVAEAEEREMTKEEQTAFDAIAGRGKEGDANYQAGEIADLRVKLQRAERREEIAAEARQSRELQNRIENGELVIGSDEPQASRKIVVPAKARVHGKLYAFDNEEDAYVAGNVILAGIYGNKAATEFCQNHGLSVKNTMTEGQGAKGGFLVPDEMQRSLVRLREERGIFPRYARNYPMASDNLFVPREINDCTAYWVGEGSEITASDDDLGAAELTAKKLACLTKVSTELDEDSVVSIGDMITRSMAYAMADKIDQAGFNGDGTSTYGGVTGLKNALNANAINDAASGNVSAATLDLADWEATAGMLPEYEGTTNVWFMHKKVYWASIRALLNASGGTTGDQIANGSPRTLFGDPVVFVQVMPSAPSTSTICAYYGDLRLAATLGNRRNVQTQVSLDRYFENDLIGIKCTERLAINVHERGDTIKTRPIVALKTAAS
jgi:HK97 family phage major capsid protein